MAEIHSVIRNIKSKNDLITNLADYKNIVLKDAYDLSLASLALNYVSLYETLSGTNAGEEEVTQDEALLGIYDALNALVKRFAAGEKVSANEVAVLRKKNIERMTEITAMIDRFTLDEYIMNRMEHLYEGEQVLPVDYSDESMTQDMLQFLASGGKDQQNILISEMIAQLPVRMTKNRFYEIVQERLSVYKTSDVSALKDIAGMLESAAGLKKIDADDTLAEVLFRLDEALKQVDPMKITEAEYRLDTALLTETALTLNHASDAAEMLELVLNSLLTAVLSQDSAEDNEEQTAAMKIILEVVELIGGESEMTIDDVYRDCEALEGKIEEFQERFTVDSAFLQEIHTRYDAELEKNGLAEEYKKADQTGVLMSNSAFASLDARLEEQEDEVTDEIFTELVRDLNSRFAALFTECKKTYVRAAMGRAFSVIPPRFATQEELESYIYGSLSGCGNVSEKLGCMDLLNELMRD